MPEAWLRGPIEGVPPELMPAAHCLVDAVEDLERAVEGLTPEQVWVRPGGAASIGFHLRHVAGSIDRLLTYSRGEGLSSSQRAGIASEGDPGDPPESVSGLLERVRGARDQALAAYRAVDPLTLWDTRPVGRAGLPSTVSGILFHVAEHARRHGGQVVATAKVVRGEASPGSP